MESIKTATRIHPLMAAAAISVITLSVAGTAAITGLLPTSQGAIERQLSAQPAPVAAPAPVPAPQLAQAAPVKRVVHRSQPVHRDTQVASNDAPAYRQPAVQAAPQQPNYLGIGAGAVIGGLVGNQIGSGNGRKLATVAGVIGGGMLGNEIANRNK